MVNSQSTRPYRPHGAAEQILYCQAPEVCLVGPAGTGKTRANLEKLNIVAEKYPGCRLLICRKTRASVTDSVLVTFEDKVLPEGSTISKGARRENRHSYRYPNGSEIVIGGMDFPTKILSTEWDIVYLAEAIEFTEDDWETLSGRLRNWRLPYQQIIADTNPAHPAHWLKSRIDRGQTLGLRSVHQDNPALWSCGDWTVVGRDYMRRLEALTGHRRKRYLLGEWSASEGARWPELDPAVHQFEMSQFRGGIPPEWHHIVGVDYGKAAPFAAVWVAIDFEGNRWVYREAYQAGLSATDQARMVCQRTSLTERLRYVNADPSCWNAPATIEPSLKMPSVADYYAAVFSADSRFGPLKRGYNKSRVHALATLDDGFDKRSLYVSRECVNLWSELTGAVWDRHGKEDIDESSPDHAITALYYAIHSFDVGPVEEKPVDLASASSAVFAALREKEDRAFRREAKRWR